MTQNQQQIRTKHRNPSEWSKAHQQVGKTDRGRCCSACTHVSRDEAPNGAEIHPVLFLLVSRSM